MRRYGRACPVCPAPLRRPHVSELDIQRKIHGPQVRDRAIPVATIPGVSGLTGIGRETPAIVGTGVARPVVPSLSTLQDYGQSPETACAGRSLSRVWPRVCRGAGITLDAALLGGGGAIPACAGEPICSAMLPTLIRGYPRVCGGTIVTDRVALPASGLSLDLPRFRGQLMAFADVLLGESR